MTCRSLTESYMPPKTQAQFFNHRAARFEDEIRIWCGRSAGKTGDWLTFEAVLSGARNPQLG
jgi:hypothetical protein